jgi:hypothetical protein
MTDLHNLLQQAAPTPPEFDETGLRRMISQRRFRRRATLAASAVALVAMIAIGVGVATSKDADQHVILVSPSSTTPTTTRTSIPVVTSGAKWRALPTAPIAARGSAASAWTGSAFVVWGGRDASFQALSDGAWYDPQARRWHSMRESPLGPAAANGFYVGIPVAGEAVIMSGTKAAVYTPGNDSWRALPDVPLAQVDAAALRMPGAPQQVIVSGVDRAGQGALAWLDSTNNGSWHTLAMHSRARVVLLPNGHVVYWYGVDGRHGVDTDPGTGAEHEIPATFDSKYPAGYPFDPRVVAGSLVISPLAQVAWNASTGAYEDLSNRSTSSTGAVPGGYCGGASAWTGRQLLTWGGSECQGDSYLDAGAEYDPSSRALQPLPLFLSGRTGMAFAWTGTELLIWGGQTNSNGHVVADGASLTVSTSTSSLPPLPAGPGTRTAGIDDAAGNGSFSHATFSVNNAYQGPIGSTWYLVFAGQLTPLAHGAGALEIYSGPVDLAQGQPTNFVGEFPFAGSSALTIRAIEGSTLRLTDTSGTTYSFDLANIPERSAGTTTTSLPG